MGGNEEARIRDVLAELQARPPASEEEFRYRLEPLRASHDLAVSILLDALGSGDWAQDLAAAALQQIARDADIERLLAAFRDRRRPEAARAEIAQVLAGVAGDRLVDLLDANELAHLSTLSLHTLLERFRDRAGLAQVIDLYRQSSGDDRRALVTAIEAATSRPSAAVRLGIALDPLFDHEPDSGIRIHMIQRLAARPEAASASALRRWLTSCHGGERRRVQEALQRLARQGIRPRGTDGGLATWLSGVDGTGCYNVGISCPAALGLRDIVLVCVSVETGLRAVSVIAGVGTDAVSEIRATLEESQGIPVSTVDPPSAFQLVRDARLRTIELGRPMPAGYAAAAAYLERPISLPSARREPEPATSDCMSSTPTLLDLPAYGSWVFPTSEIPAEIVADLSRELAGLEPLTGCRETGASRVGALAARAVSALEGTSIPLRLTLMLRHQAMIHRLRSEPSAADRALAAAREIESREITRSALALRMMERSLRALRAPGIRPPRLEVRETFKRWIEKTGRPRRRDVLTLHLAEALSRHVEDVSERLSPSERLTLDQIERLAFDSAAITAREFTRDSTEQIGLPGFAAPQVTTRSRIRRRVRASGTRVVLQRDVASLLSRETGFADERTQAMATAMATVTSWFADEICLRRCRRECLMDPEADGRELFYAPTHPAGLDEPADSPGRCLPPSLLAPWRHLSRRLDDLIGESTSFFEALSDLGFLPNGSERNDRQRMEEVVARIRILRHECSQAADPASLYSRIDETEGLDAGLTALARSLLSAALRPLRPSPEQFRAFRPDGAARLAWRRFERLLRTYGLFDLDLGSLHAALDRLDSTTSLLSLLRLATRPRSAARSRILAERLTDFSNHTPRSRLGAQTPLQKMASSEPAF